MPNVTIRTGRTTENFSYLDNTRKYTRSIGVETIQNSTINHTAVVTASLLYDRQTGL
jgi:hypothetical protein